MKAVFNIKNVISMTIVFLSFGYFFVTYFFGKQQSDPQIVIAIVAALSQVLNYQFGSTHGSSKKDDTLNNLSQNVTKNEN